MGNICTAIFGGGNNTLDDTDGQVQYITGEVMTGQPNNVLSELKNRLHNYSRGASAEYIGIASGRDGESAMKSRYDGYKKSLGINQMRTLYESSSHDHVREVEREN